MSIILSQIPLEQLLELMQQVCEKTLRQILQETFPPTCAPIKEYLTESEACAFLGNISRTLFFQLKKKGKFPTYYCGENRCLYSRQDLIRYLQTNQPTSDSLTN